MVVRESFDNNLQELQGKISLMTNLAISLIEKAFEALKTQDVEIALKVIEDDTVIDNLETEINQFVIWLIAKEQPVARDLRRIIGALKISSEIERIADFAVNIAKSTIKIGSTHSLVKITKLEQMKDLSITMLEKALTSFIEENIVLAKEVGDLDDKVDNYSGDTYKAITNYLKEHPEEAEQLMQLLFINRYLERTADHITNIAESAAYLIKGRIYDFNS
ncbi:phosphate signaling complex protein PhoU [Metabacillus schmidteae]|uniref:phosphate signaling complex protein PhoU n=1 Tax=Metabacillus schmidteae TaxID=2730405 RepID=UPI0015883FF1|nr:phosphate signaling complex protein PhoU [Metabacillus schmidteae]